jgi:hypothetical protein
VYAGPPQRPDDFPHRQQAGLAALCQASGAILALAALTCSLLSLISAQQAIAMALPAAVLIIGGLIAAPIPGHSTAGRLGFQAGLRAGTFVNLWRSLIRHRG